MAALVTNVRQKKTKVTQYQPVIIYCSSNEYIVGIDMKSLTLKVQLRSCEHIVLKYQINQETSIFLITEEFK